MLGLKMDKRVRLASEWDMFRAVWFRVGQRLLGRMPDPHDLSAMAKWDLQELGQPFDSYRFRAHCQFSSDYGFFISGDEIADELPHCLEAAVRWFEVAEEDENARYVVAQSFKCAPMLKLFESIAVQAIEARASEVQWRKKIVGPQLSWTGSDGKQEEVGLPPNLLNSFRGILILASSVGQERFCQYWKPQDQLKGVHLEFDPNSETPLRFFYGRGIIGA